MWKLRLGVGLASAALVLGTGTTALAANSGDSNGGDVWVDDASQSAGPGHEMDSHLPCRDVNLWGSGLANGSGSFTIDGWPPSGSQTVDYSGSWSYGAIQGGTQRIAVIRFSQLLEQAQTNGEEPTSQGYHFKLDLSQDPQKHKTFWLDCPAPSDGGNGDGNGGGGNDGGGGGGNGGTDGGGGGGTTGTPNPGITSSSTGSTPIVVGTVTRTAVSSIYASRPRTHAARRRRRRRPMRHGTANARRRASVRAVHAIRAPSFTG
jgi:hypothetical protein